MTYNIDGTPSKRARANTLRKGINKGYSLLSTANKVEKIMTGDVWGYLKTQFIRGKYRRFSSRIGIDH